MLLSRHGLGAQLESCREGSRITGKTVRCLSVARPKGGASGQPPLCTPARCLNSSPRQAVLAGATWPWHFGARWGQRMLYKNSEILLGLHTEARHFFVVDTLRGPHNYHSQQNVGVHRAGLCKGFYVQLTSTPRNASPWTCSRAEGRRKNRVCKCV